MTFKCKMCGASLTISAGQSIVTCDYCDTQQTIPKLQDARIANLYDRANHFRRNNDFDKAMGIYESILNEDNTDAEAYWSLVLCRYGIEYVEDPKTKKRIPTVNRAQFTSIFDDQNYKSALAHADNQQRKLYEAEAHAINEIQKNILAISQKEEPFDVFICYKETDANGRRTMDSVLATELYQELTREGFKVFFSRITLEDKLGVAYEPYIFAALQSSKVMVVLGTRPEHFNAVWVKNEWSRYLSLIKNDAKKLLIPAYRDMDPYHLPPEFSHLQAQDMAKLGFMQDLTRGIQKILQADKPVTIIEPSTPNVIPTPVALNISPLLKRAFMFLEDGEWSSADEYCEKVLDQEPECAEAYLGKLMIELQVKQRTDLAHCAHPFQNSKNYQKAIRFADSQLKAELTDYLNAIKARIENERLEKQYIESVQAMNTANTESDYKSAAKLFAALGDYKDCPRLKADCSDKAEAARIANEKRMAKRKKGRGGLFIVATCLLTVAGVVGIYVMYPFSPVKQNSPIVPSTTTATTPPKTPDTSSPSENTTYVIPQGTTHIKDGAFMGRTDLTKVVIPDSVTSIGDDAFSKCSSLTDITIPDSVTSIGTGAFKDCSKLTSVTIPNGITTIATSAFYRCTGLTHVTIPSSVKTIERLAFADCSNLTSVTIPDSVTTIEESAFSYCFKLTNVTIPNSVTSIGDSAFYFCTKLSDVTIPDGVQSIGAFAFRRCKSINEITIPDSVTSIGTNAFAGCPDLTFITFNGTSAQWYAISLEYNWIDSSSLTIHCTDGDIKY